MNKLALQEIDFYRLRDEVAGYCITQEGKDSFLQREPLTDSKKIEQLKNLSREWNVYLSAKKLNLLQTNDLLTILEKIVATAPSSKYEKRVRTILAKVER